MQKHPSDLDHSFSLFQGGIAMSYDAVNRMVGQWQRLYVDGNVVEQHLVIDYNKVFHHENMSVYFDPSKPTFI